MDLALSYPNLVTNLVIINSPLKGDFIAGFDPLLHLEHLAKLAVVEGFLKIYTHFHLLALPIESRRYAHFRMLFSQSCRRVQRELAQCTVQSLFGCYKMVRRADLSQQIADLQPPTLVIVSDQDNVVPPHQAQLICEQVEQAHLARISGSGHLPLDEQPDLFDAALKDYLTIRKESSLE